MTFFTNIQNWLYGKFGYVAVNELETVKNQPVTDESIEKIDISFAKNVREVIRWYGANGTDIPSVVNANKAGIIGTKVNIQSRIKDNPELNTQIEEYIGDFSSDENCEVTGRWHLDEVWRSMVEFTDKDGGFLVRHHFNNEWEIPYRFELIEVGMIDTSKNFEKNNVLNGIKKDKYGRITGIYLFTDQNRRISKLVSKSELIYYSPVWISLSQYTAVSKLATILPSIDNLEQYSDAELKSAIEKSKAGRYWKTSLYDDIMKIARQTQDSKAKNENISKLMKRISEQAVKPQGLTAVPRDDEIVSDSNNTDSIYTALTNNSQLKVSSSQGLSSQIVYQDPSKSNYSAIKAMLALAQINWSIEFDNLSKKVMTPILKNVIKAGVTAGHLQIDGYFNNPKQFHKFDFMRVSEIDIEPMKTATANAKNIENGTHSKRELISRRGRNIEDVYREEIEDEIQKEKLKKEMYAKAGVQIPTQESK